MKPTVYIETTIIGYLTAWPRNSPLFAARQNSTRDWWSRAELSFTIVSSQIVWNECAAGDSIAAQERLEVLKPIPLLPITDTAEQLARQLIHSLAIPANEQQDALHIAIAAVHGTKYLATWNFRHIANATLRTRIERVCRDAGFEPSIICCPDELVETQDIER